MTCINESCKSTNVIVLKKAETTVIKKVGDALCIAVGSLGCLVRGLHYSAGKYVTQKNMDFNKSAKKTYKCLKCGCTWSMTDW